MKAANLKEYLKNIEYVSWGVLGLTVLSRHSD